MLVIQFNICESNNCKSIVFNETTGIYNSESNPTAWGDPNPETSDATNATLLIKTPSNTTGVLLDLFSTFPTSNLNTERIITSSDLNLTANSSFEDGLYSFLYTVTTSQGVFTQYKEEFFFCNINCCVNNMYKNIEIVECEDCQKKKLIDANLADTFLEVLKRAAECGSKDRFNNSLILLRKLCSNQDCSNCQ